MRLQIVVFLCLISGFQALFCCAAASPPVLTLNDAVMLALRYNPEIRSARLQRVVDRFNLRVAQWAYEIQYSLTANYNYNDPVVAGQSNPQNLTTIAPTTKLLTPIGTAISVSANNAFNQNVGHGIYYNPTVTFSITQPLLKSFGRDVTLEPLHAAQYAEMSAKLNYKNQLMQTITNVVIQYANVVSAQNALKVGELSLHTSVATLNQQQALVKAGRAAPADLIQFQATVAAQQLMLEQQQVALQQVKQQLLITLGINPYLPINIDDHISYPSQTILSLTDSIHAALQNNTDYQQALIKIKDDELQLLLAKDAQKWELDATAQRVQGQGITGGTNTSSTLLNNFNVVNAYGISLTIPIDDLGAKNKLLQAKIALQQERIALAAAKATLISTITNDYYTVISQKQQIIQAQQAVNLAKKNLAIAQAKYHFGRTTAFELSSLQAAVTTAQITYINAQTAYFTNLATFDQALGLTLSRWGLKVCY